MAAAEEAEDAGNQDYHGRHMGAIFEEGFSFSGFERDFVALGDGTGKWTEISGASGLDSISDGRGAVFADFDNDGDTDVFLTTLQGEAHLLYRNNVGNRNGFLRVTLQGTTSAHDAFGAVVRVKTSAGTLTKIKTGGSGFLSQHDPRLLFGLGRDRKAEWVEVVWPSGATSRFENVPVGTSLNIVEGETEFTSIAESRFTLADPPSRLQTLLAGIGRSEADALPNLALTQLSGEATHLDDVMLPKRRYLVNFWATYCVPCAEEMPELQELRSKLSAAGIELIGVSVDIETADQVQGYARARGVDYPIYIAAEQSVADVFVGGEVIIPTSFLIDEHRRVLDVYLGWSARTRRALEQLVAPPRPRVVDVPQVPVSNPESIQ